MPCKHRKQQGARVRNPVHVKPQQSCIKSRASSSSSSHKCCTPPPPPLCDTSAAHPRHQQSGPRVCAPIIRQRFHLHVLVQGLHHVHVPHGGHRPHHQRNPHGCHRDASLLQRQPRRPHTCHRGGRLHASPIRRQCIQKMVVVFWLACSHLAHMQTNLWKPPRMWKMRRGIWGKYAQGIFTCCSLLWYSWLQPHVGGAGNNTHSTR